MIYGSVCSGIEAATVAWHPLGWKPSFFSEIEKAPRAILAHHYPEVPLHGDFTSIKSGSYGPIDLLVGGTPCQDFSIAGLRAGLDGDRGNLSLEYLRLADQLQPRWLVWENVPGVLSIDGGRAFGAILGGLGELGYGFAYRVLDAQHFGVPQRRRRVFVVGHLGDHRRAAAVLFERHSLSGHPAPRRQTREGFAGRPGPGFAFDGQNVGVSCLDGAAGTLDTRSAHLNRGLHIAHALRGEGFDASEDGTGRGTPLVPVSFTGGASDCITLENCAHPVTGRNGDAGMVSFAIQERAVSENLAHGPQGKGYQAEVAYTLEARNKVQAVAASAVRRLTPRECERLQGFPDDYTLVPHRKGMMVDGPRYKALGNSMAVPVMRWIGERIEMVDAL